MGYFIPPNGGSGPRTQIYYTFIRDGAGSKGHAYRYNKVSDSHNYFFVRCAPTWGYRMQLGHEDSGFKQSRGWYDVTIVRTRDGRIYSYITDIGKNKTYLQFLSNSKAGDTCSYLRMSLNRPLWDMFPRVTVYVDGLEIYKDKYLFPSKSAVYGEYVENWKWRADPIHDPSSAYLVDNSTIDNCAYMFIDAPRRVRFRNTRLTNLHQVDAGEYSAKPGTEVEKRKKFIKGPKAFCVFIKNYWVFDFDFDRVKFSAAGKPVDIIFRLNSDKNRLNVYNSDFGSENVVVKPSVKMMSFWNSRWPEYYNSVLGMVNCRFKSISIPEERAFAAPKYFLDVKVVRAGKAVPGAKVTVACEVAGGKYPPENMVVKYDHFNKDPRLYVVAIKMGQPISTTTTTATGHTPGPSDKARTLILPDFVQDASGRKEFTYTITVEKGGKKKVITGVNPGPDWYRPDPDKPTYTITAVLDSKTETEAELKNK
ncbi:MAG: hypothetical protein SVV80_14320, partial [Planctomycetota bacterium]|nr:hypothetical protein [Planctomycetota bacterium]